MGTEVELKLAAPPSVLRQAMHARWLTKAAAGQVSRRPLASLYFDTPDFALRNHGITLRVRKSDTTNLQTIKATTELRRLIEETATAKEGQERAHITLDWP